MNSIKSLLLITLAIVFLTNCSTPKGVLRSEDFNLFYNRFHSDTVFQLKRIKFPIDGYRVDHDGETLWNKENWNYLTTKVYDVDTTKYSVHYEKLNNSFYQKSWIMNSGFNSEYRFELLKRKWYLVYALDQNL